MADEVLCMFQFAVGIMMKQTETVLWQVGAE